MNKKLTKKQKSLLKELDKIYALLKMDHWKIHEYPVEYRTTTLELQKNQIIRSAVIIQYTLIDEHLNNQICKYFWGTKKNHIKLWKTKKLKIFNYHILENLYLLQKLKLVKDIMKIPKNVAADIDKMNALRNSLAHAFFPENLNKYKPIYKGKNIFLVDGIKLFIDDMGVINDFFLSKI
jgi:hypothetical protein